MARMSDDAELEWLNLLDQIRDGQRLLKALHEGAVFLFIGLVQSPIPELFLARSSSWWFPRPPQPRPSDCRPRLELLTSFYLLLAFLGWTAVSGSPEPHPFCLGLQRLCQSLRAKIKSPTRFLLLSPYPDYRGSHGWSGACCLAPNERPRRSAVPLR